MKKFGKFIFTTVSLAAVIGGAVYVVKNLLNKDSNDDFDDFDDDFEDFDFDSDDEAEDKDDREYVTINLNDSDETDSAEEDSAENKESEE